MEAISPKDNVQIITKTMGSHHFKEDCSHRRLHAVIPQVSPHQRLRSTLGLATRSSREASPPASTTAEQSKSLYQSIVLVGLWGFPYYWIITIANILGSIIPYNHQPTGLLNTAQLKVPMSQASASSTHPTSLWPRIHRPVAIATTEHWRSSRRPPQQPATSGVPGGGGDEAVSFVQVSWGYPQSSPPGFSMKESMKIWGYCHDYGMPQLNTVRTGETHPHLPSSYWDEPLASNSHLLGAPVLDRPTERSHSPGFAVAKA